MGSHSTVGPFTLKFSKGIQSTNSTLDTAPSSFAIDTWASTWSTFHVVVSTVIELPSTLFSYFISNLYIQTAAVWEEGLGSLLLPQCYLPTSTTTRRGILKDLKLISHSFQPRPALIQADLECDRVIWFPSLIERRKSRWRFNSSLFIYVRSSPILRDRAMEWRSIDGSIVEWHHFAAFGRLECAVHSQA